MFKKKSWLIWVAIGISVIGYLFFGYDLIREDTIKLLFLYTVIFGAYLYLVYQREALSVKELIAIGMVFRLLFLLSTPSLSDDFYRFIWDGRLWFNGINPFAELPVFYMNNPNLAPYGINLELFNLINSPTHYTVYPPIPQFINWIAAWLASDSIWASTIILRMAHIAAEFGTLLLFTKVLSHYKIASKNIAWYALNPLIIIELVGNLHHEALMIFFLMLFLVHFQRANINTAAFAFAMAIAAKLIPLIFLPLVLLKMNVKQNLRFILVLSLSLLISFAPLLDASFFRGIENSLLLYYQKFEFNAGIYYVFRELGFWIKGYNTIAIIGKLFAIGTTLSILIISIIASAKKWQLPIALLWISTLFAMFSLILHPWYIALVVLFATITRYKFGIFWSFLIMGTYAGYSAIGFKEVMPIVAVEFGFVLLMIFVETRTHGYAKLNAR